MQVGDQKNIVASSSVSSFTANHLNSQIGLLNLNRKAASDDPFSNNPIPQAAPPSITKAALIEQIRSKKRQRPNIPESELLRDVIFLFQGVNGRHVQFDDKVQALKIDSAEISNPTKEMLNRLAELGWLYKRIQRYTERKLDNMGLVEQSFVSALQERLSEYYRTIAILETQLESLSLKRLLIWTEDARHRLRMMSVLVDSSQVGGGALVSAIHAYANHGDPFIQQFTDTLLEQVSKPFFHMLQRWIYEGELQDPYDEFFVQMNEVAVDDEKAWHKKHSLRTDMKPSFITNDLALKIFSIGKSLNFLRYSCKDADWVEEQSRLTDQRALQYSDLAALAASIDSAYSLTSKRLIHTLDTRYHLLKHLNAAKRYMMLGQGDFAEALMDYLNETLNQPANTLFRHNLTAALESAIRSSNAQFDDAVVLKNLDARMLQVSQGEIGWDIFTLEYKFGAPLNTIVPPSVLTQYLQVFHFLWRLKRVEYALKKAWRSSMTGARRILKIPDLEYDWHQCRIVSAEMIHFVYQLQYYLLFEVIESAWAELVAAFQKDQDLDNVIKAHQRYIERILTKSFLEAGVGTRDVHLLSHIKEIFRVILQYKDAMDSLYQFSLTEESRRAELRLLARQRTDKGGWGLKAGEELDKIPQRQLEQVLPKIRTRLQESAGEFQERLITLLSLLTTHRDQDVKFLAVRLNYSEHYQPQRR